MFETQGSSLVKHIARKTALWAIIGLAIWGLLLMHTSAEFDKQRVSRETNATLGPLTLNHISKHSLESGGHSVTISVEPDALWYAGFWLGLGIAHGLIEAKRRAGHNTPAKTPKASSPLGRTS